MNTSTLSVERRADGVFSDLEQQALLGFLGGYSGLTRDAYALDLRQFAAWCQQRQLALFDVARHDIEGFARQLEERGRARATISRRLCTITSLYRYAVEERLLERSPAVHVRRPRLRHRARPQRSRSDARHRRPRRRPRTRAALTAGVERAACLRGDRRRHRTARSRAWASHPGGVTQGRQDRHDPARPEITRLHCDTTRPSARTRPVSRVIGREQQHDGLRAVECHVGHPAGRGRCFHLVVAFQAFEPVP
jgi:hypothetical protein